MDDGAWALGSVERTALRYRFGGLKVQRAGRIWHRIDALRLQDPKLAATATWMWWEGKLLMQGFALIDVFRGEPDSRVEEFLRRRFYQWSNDVDARLREILAEDDQDSRDETWQDRAAKYSALLDEHKLRDAHRHAFKKPVSFTSRLSKKVCA